MSSAGARLALVVGSLAAAGGGWLLAHRLADDDTTGTIATAVDFYDCPADDGSTLSVGQLHAGDRVWLLGVTGDRWAVIRSPGNPEQPAWVPLAMVHTEASAGDLPQLTCADAVGVPTTAASTTEVVTTVAGGTTTIVGDTGPTTTVEDTTTSSTIPIDIEPPTVTITTDRPYLYVLSTSAPCSDEDALDVTIALADASLPLSIRSIVATWDSPAGPQTANLVPVSGNHFRLEVPINGPATGETPLTLTAKGADGVGNVGVGQLVVSLRTPLSFGCAG